MTAFFQNDWVIDIFMERLHRWHRNHSFCFINDIGFLDWFNKCLLFKTFCYHDVIHNLWFNNIQGTLHLSTLSLRRLWYVKHFRLIKDEFAFIWYCIYIFISKIRWLLLVFSDFFKLMLSFDFHAEVPNFLTPAQRLMWAIFSPPPEINNLSREHQKFLFRLIRHE